VQAGAAGNGYGAQPATVGTSGASTPTGCTSANPGSQASGGTAGATANNRFAGSQSAANSGGTSNAGPSSAGTAGAVKGQDASRGWLWFWLALALLVGFLLFLLGVVVAPKRRHQGTAAS